jgi:hypothetical protein
LTKIMTNSKSKKPYNQLSMEACSSRICQCLILTRVSKVGNRSIWVSYHHMLTNTRGILRLLWKKRNSKSSYQVETLYHLVKNNRIINKISHSKHIKHSKHSKVKLNRFNKNTCRDGLVSFSPELWARPYWISRKNKATYRSYQTTRRN